MMKLNFKIPFMEIREIWVGHLPRVQGETNSFINID